MFGWDDTKKDPKRRDSRLIVIGDDRQTPLQRGALTAFRNYGVTVIPYSKLEERAPGLFCVYAASSMTWTSMTSMSSCRSGMAWPRSLARLAVSLWV